MSDERVIVLVDMDCFYCQVEELLNPILIGKPVAVVQYNQWKGGGILAVNYEARAQGVTRHMRGNEAKEKCPEIQLVHVSSNRGKADISKYRNAGKRVADVLQSFTTLLERASVDEAYLDITEAVKKRMECLSKVEPQMLRNTHIIGFGSVQEFLEIIYSDQYVNESNIMLAVGGVIAEEIRAAVYDKTGYRCSAGIAHNKILAKLVCGLHKPNKQTVLPMESIQSFYRDTNVKKFRGLGGKFGNLVMDKLKVTNMSEVAQLTEAELLKHFEPKSAKWLFNIAQGIDLEPVTVRLVSQSIGCCKQFKGRAALKTEEEIKHWLRELALEIISRIDADMEENNRKPKQVTVNYAQKVGKQEITNSRTQNLSHEVEKLATDAFEIVRKNCQHSDGSFHITFLGYNVGKFEKNNGTSIMDFFKNANSSSKINEQKSTTSKELPSFNGVNIKTSEKIEEEEEEEEIAAELSKITESQDHCRKHDKSSFFNKFLDGTNRDFNTSAILEEQSMTETRNSEDVQKISDDGVENMSEPQMNENSTASLTHNYCEECHKQILIEEFTSHQDYHFAIKIVREEASLYNKKAQNTTEQNKNKNTTNAINKCTKETNKTTSKSKKRKMCDGSVSIMNFLKPQSNKEDKAIENGVFCSDCEKLIDDIDFSSHMDFHAAKKLHLELNSMPSNINNKPKTGDKVAKSNIKSFFKKL